MKGCDTDLLAFGVCFQQEMQEIVVCQVSW